MVRSTIIGELNSPEQHFGYRTMWQMQHPKCGFTLRRDDVMRLMADLDLSGVEQRHRWIFVSRVYHSLGPNHVWHVDGYDKLKPYHFAISCCIDDYSRRVMWLCVEEATTTYRSKLNTTCSLSQNIPMRLCTDCGTENGVMAAIYCAWRSAHKDEFAGAASHVYMFSSLSPYLYTLCPLTPPPPAQSHNLLLCFTFYVCVFLFVVVIVHSFLSFALCRQMSKQRLF